jgi:hypothetical protein
MAANGDDNEREVEKLKHRETRAQEKELRLTWEPPGGLHRPPARRGTNLQPRRPR